MHPKTYAAWKAAGFNSLQDIPQDNWSTELRTYDAFLKRVLPENRGKMEFEITAIYRIQDFEGGEYLVYNQDVIAKDRFGDPIRPISVVSDSTAFQSSRSNTMRIRTARYIPATSKA